MEGDVEVTLPAITSTRDLAARPQLSEDVYLYLYVHLQT